LTDAERLPDPLAAVARLPRGGAVCGRPAFHAGVVVRERDAEMRRALAEKTVTPCRVRRIAVLIANDARLARAYRAAGVHLSEETARHGLLSTLALPRSGSHLRGRMIVSVAAHSARAIARAARLRADIVLLAPAFATRSHPRAEPIGAVRFALMTRAARRAGVRVFALGGVTGANAERLARAGAWGFAAIGALA
jgi:thiamine-phosphate pyrophosphorylase